MAQTIAGVNIALSAESATLIREINKSNQAIANFAKQSAASLKNVESAAARANKFLMGITGGFVGTQILMQAARTLREYSDAWREAGNKIAAAAQISGGAALTLEQVNDIAIRARAPIEDVTDLYSKLLRVSGEVGASQLQVAQATETVSKAFKAGGASTLEQVNGIRQLAQALGSGILQGDELRSIRENAPLIAKAIAEEFNTSIAGLKKLGAAGMLESDRVFKAIIKGQAEIEAAFSKTTPTIADSFTILRNVSVEALGRINEVTGASASFTTQVIDLANAIDKLSKVNSESSGITGELIEGYNNLNKYVEDNSFFMNKAGEATNTFLTNKLKEWLKEAGVNYDDIVKKLMSFNQEMATAIGRVRTFSATSTRPPGGLPLLMEKNLEAAKVPTFESWEDRAKGKFTSSGRAGGAFPLRQQAAEVRAYEEALEAATKAEAEWAAGTTSTVTPAGERLMQFWSSIPDLVTQTMGPLQQYQEQLRLIALSEAELAEAGISAAQLRQQAVLGLAETALGAAGAMSGALAALFKENKAFAIANVVVHTAEAIVSALKNPPGPPFSYVYAAAAAVTGAAQLAAIMSAKPGGGKISAPKGGGKKGSSGGSAEESVGGGTSGPSQTIVLQIKGDIFGPDHFRKMVEGLNGVMSDGTVLLRTT